MIVLLNHREIELITRWRERAFWPDEERVLAKLRKSLESAEPLNLSRLQIRIIQGWVEEQVGGHYGGRSANQEEQAIGRKLRAALEAG